EAPVDLDAQVDIVADRLAELAHGVDRLAHLGRVRLEVGALARLVAERREMADGGEAARLRGATALHQAVDRLAQHVVVDACLVARFAAEQRVDGHAEVLAGDVPQGDVDSAQRAHDRRAAEVRGSVQVLPVVLDTQRILADQVVREFGNDLLGGLQEPPGAGFAQPDEAGVGVHFNKQVAVDRPGFDAGDLHDSQQGTWASLHFPDGLRPGIRGPVARFAGRGTRAYAASEAGIAQESDRLRVPFGTAEPVLRLGSPTSSRTGADNHTWQVPL